jgi:hypothetical protein
VGATPKKFCKKEFEKYRSSSIEEDEYYLLCLEKYNKFMNN